MSLLLGLGDVADLLPALSSVRINGAEIGQLAAGMLIERAEGHEPARRVIDVGYSIVERDTS